MESSPSQRLKCTLKCSNKHLVLISADQQSTREILKSHFLYYYEQWGQLIIDRFAAAYLHSQNLIDVPKNSPATKFISDLSSTNEYRMYEHYRRKGFFVMADQTFGSMFAVYNEVGLLVSALEEKSPCAVFGVPRRYRHGCGQPSGDHFEEGLCHRGGQLRWVIE